LLFIALLFVWNDRFVWNRPLSAGLCQPSGKPGCFLWICGDPSLTRLIAMTPPVRTCLGCRQRAAKSDLLRLAWAQGRVVVDLDQVLPGRGAYLHPGCGPAALRRRPFGRALRQPVEPGQVEQLLATTAD